MTIGKLMSSWKKANIRRSTIGRHVLIIAYVSVTVDDVIIIMIDHTQSCVFIFFRLRESEMSRPLPETNRYLETLISADGIV